MTNDPLELLRAANPVAEEVPPPPLELVTARRQAELPQRPRRRRLAGSAIPLAGALAAVAVAVLALGTLSHRPASSGAHVPRTGMPGPLVLLTAGFSSPSHGLIFFQQCSPCRAPRWQLITDWEVAGGRRRRAPDMMFTPSFGQNRDVWVAGAHGTYVSHDGGLSWRRAIAGPSAVSVAGGETWAVRSACAGARCRWTVLRGRAGGASLIPAADQPDLSGSDVVATGALSAYLTAGRSLLATTDGGASWRRVTDPCRHQGADVVFSASGRAALWQVCPTAPWERLARSDDGGRTWRTLQVPALGGIYDLVATSPSTAWIVTDGGFVTRTTDGGASWRIVWAASREAVDGIRPRMARLSAQSPRTAEVTAILTRRGLNNLVVFSTRDGGRRWSRHVVTL